MQAGKVQPFVGVVILVATVVAVALVVAGCDHAAAVAAAAAAAAGCGSCFEAEKTQLVFDLLRTETFVW